MHTARLLAAYDQQVRGSFPNRIPATWTSDFDGPLTRCLTESGGFVLSSPTIRELTDADLDRLIARTLAFYRGLGRSFEWKTFAHDGARIAQKLADAGLIPAATEALVLGETGGLTGPEDPIADVTIRTGSIEDLPAVAEMEEEVWSRSWDWFVPELTARMSAPEPTYLVLAESVDRVVSAGWLVPMPGTTCAGLWGGSTLSQFRGRGIYRALVRARANEAARLGYHLLQVDATDASRPILERLGLYAVGTTTPYNWHGRRP